MVYNRLTPEMATLHLLLPLLVIMVDASLTPGLTTPLKRRVNNTQCAVTSHKDYLNWLFTLPCVGVYSSYYPVN